MAASRVTLVLLLAACLAGVATAQGDWKTGRATFYGTDAWSIHKGSCGYGWLDKNVATGWDVAAISDKAWDYSGSCGKCKEIKCNPTSFNDGYGQYIDRSSVCFDSSKSVVVMVTDTCQCQYPNNAYSNKRWCCGDMYHLDISVWALEKLADTKWGVIGMSWRDVPCWYKPSNPASVPSWKQATPQPWWEKEPSGWNKAQDRRVGNRVQWQNGRK